MNLQICSQSQHTKKRKAAPEGGYEASKAPKKMKYTLIDAHTLAQEAHGECTKKLFQTREQLEAFNIAQKYSKQADQPNNRTCDDTCNGLESSSEQVSLNAEERSSSLMEASKTIDYLAEWKRC